MDWRPPRRQSYIRLGKCLRQRRRSQLRNFMQTSCSNSSSLAQGYLASVWPRRGARDPRGKDPRASATVYPHPAVIRAKSSKAASKSAIRSLTASNPT